MSAKWGFFLEDDASTRGERFGERGAPATPVRIVPEHDGRALEA
jgi:hypothetical protein